jgi:leader peptidase (prepilin peptidase)/N-methyltransferase
MWYENIPLISFIFLKGKCAGCGWKISLLYPIVELMTGTAALLIFRFLIVPAWASGISPEKIASLILQSSILLVTIPITVIDIYFMEIPDEITIPGFIIAFLLSLLPGGITPLQSALGILSGGGTLLFVSIVGKPLVNIFKKKENKVETVMGLGDVKLMTLIGATWGWKITSLTLVFGVFTGAITGLFLMAIKLTKNNLIPFGPFLALGLWLAVFLGEKIVFLYNSSVYDFLFK